MSPEDMNTTPVQDAPKKSGPRKASEVIAETEERVRAEAAEELAVLKARLAAAEEKVEQMEASQSSLLEEQLKPAEINVIPEGTPGSVTVNFLADDMTILGKSWYRGEELTVAPGTPEWEELWDKKLNKSYLEYTEDEQVIVWGERKFRPGKWSGLSYEDLLSNPDITEEERERLQTILNKRLSRSASPSGSTTSQKRSPIAYS